MIVNALPIDKGIIFSNSPISCSYSSFINVAKYYNNNICEELAFLKRNGLKTITNIETISSLENIVITNRFNQMIIEFLDDYNIENEFIAFNSYLEFTEYIDEQLNHLNPIIIMIPEDFAPVGVV